MQFKTNKSLSRIINSSVVLDVIIQHVICGAKSYHDDARTNTNNFKVH